jgi:hypothetical protein
MATFFKVIITKPFIYSVICNIESWHHACDRAFSKQTRVNQQSCLQQT